MGDKMFLRVQGLHVINSLGYKTRKRRWTQDLLTHMIGRVQLPWRIMAFPDLAEVQPSGFKKCT